jgi:acyl transferase domain-containing protein
MTKDQPLDKKDAVRRTLEPIAVVGVSAIFPGSIDKTGFWHDILVGKDLIKDIPPTHWLKEDYYDPDPAVPDKTYAHRGAFLDPVPFDPLEWGVPPSIVPATDTTQLLALVVAKQVLEDATRGRWPNVDKERTSCILGVTSAQELLGTMVSRLQHPIWKNSLRGLGYAEDEVDEITRQMTASYPAWQESTFPGLLGNVVAGRIANRLDLGGTNCVTDAACASSFSAISMAANELWLGQSDLVICGGADTMNDIFMYMCFSKTPALSKSGECAPFSDKSDGTLLGEGIGMVALKRLSDAERDGDHVYAVLKGIGSSSDGRSKSVYAPVSEGQAKALRRAYEQAGYSASTVELVEAHGTGTKAGDAAEFDGLRIAFDETGRADRQWCAIGTVKSQIGHTKAAAGAAGLFKAVMALHHKVLPPTLKIETPNPKLKIEQSPFYLNTRSRPWIRGSDHPRRASVSSFGFGGSNFHLAVEEYRGPAEHAPKLRALPAELVVLSAATPAELAAAAKKLAGNANQPGFLAYAAHHTQTTADPAMPARLAVVAADERELRQKLEQLVERITKSPAEPFHLPTGSSYATGEQPGPVAFLFPGQGSQYVGMGGDVAMFFDGARSAWDAAADLKMGEGATAVHGVVFPRPGFHADAERRQEDELRKTEWAQPAIGVASLALLALTEALGLRPDLVGGHSYGEITALHAAGVLSAADTVRIARRRGELMAGAASAPGAMTAVPATIDVVQAHVDAVPGCVVANHNAPQQVVVSGPTDAVAALERRLLAAGIEPKRLQVATAFHSPVVAGAVEPFAAFLKDIPFAKATLPCWHNPTAAPHQAGPDAVKAGVAAAVAQPVRFVDQVESMYAAGARTFVEVGPGQVLTNLVTETLGARPHVAVGLDRRKKNGVGQLFAALGRLFVAGHRQAFGALWAGYATPTDPHARPVPKMAIKVDGSNHGKPYPPRTGAKGRNAPNPVRTGFAASKGGGVVEKPVYVEKIVEKPVYVEKIVEKPVYVEANTSADPTGAFMPQHPQSPADPWVLAFQEAQRATVEAHAAYQRSMAQSHEQFLRTIEASFHGLSRMTGGGYAPAPQPQPLTLPLPQPVYTAPAPVYAPPAPAPVYAAPAPVYAAPVPAPAPPPRPAPAPAPRPAPIPAPAPAAAAVDVEKLLMEVVAEKTGYPSEMLAPHMALEADLGVDSIKRVEILSAVRERAPGLPEVDAGEMAKLQTLGQVVDHLRASLPAPVLRAPRRVAHVRGPRPPVDRRRGRGEAPDGGGRREDRLPLRDARAPHGARGRSRHRQHQARRDPLRRPRARPGPARGRRRRDGQAPDARPGRRPPPGLAPRWVVADHPLPCRARRRSRRRGRRRAPPDGGRRREDGVPRRDAGPPHGAGGRPRRRQHQARRDPVRRPRARPGPARGRRRRDGQAPDARPGRRPPARDAARRRRRGPLLTGPGPGAGATTCAQQPARHRPVGARRRPLPARRAVAAGPRAQGPRGRVARGAARRRRRPAPHRQGRARPRGGRPGPRRRRGGVPGRGQPRAVDGPRGRVPGRSRRRAPVRPGRWPVRDRAGHGR